MKSTLRNYWPIIPAYVIFGLLARHLDFIQDDAFITYRYVANYLAGDGLVYNLGERVEGFTNFGWVIWLAAIGKVGLDFIFWSKVIGFLFGLGIILFTFLMARDLFDQKNVWFAWAAVYLVAINQSLAYWSPAGLETAAFGFFALLSLWLYLSRNWLLIFSLLLAVWLRPEGALLAGLLMTIEAISHRRMPSFTLRCSAVALVLSLPFVLFKMLYYGSIFPNPFYAKTGFNVEQLSSGIEYVARFLQHYGLYYVGALALILPLLLYRGLHDRLRAIWLFTIGYMLYILLVGGDVLKVHRFFIPLIGPFAILLVNAIWFGLHKLKRTQRRVILVVAMLAICAVSYELPRAFVERYNQTEQGFVHKMRFRAVELKKSDSTNFSVALPTIGVFGYELLGHNIIDMVGLTDTTIARYSEDPIPGMETTWKEQKHNSRYLLGRSPDYIVFSTDLKPSAPAERALLLYRQFMDCYRTRGWFYDGRDEDGRGVLTMAFKRVCDIEGDIVPVYPVEYVQEYKDGLDAYVRKDHQTAIRHYARARKASPGPVYVYVDAQLAWSLLAVNRAEEGLALMASVLARDSLVFEAHNSLYYYAAVTGNKAAASIHSRWLQELVPWYWPRAERLAKQALARQNQRR